MPRARSVTVRRSGAAASQNDLAVANFVSQSAQWLDSQFSLAVSGPIPLPTPNFY